MKITMIKKLFILDDSHIDFVSPEEQAELDIILSDPEAYEFGKSEELNIEF